MKIPITIKNIATEIWKMPFHPLAWGIYPVLALYLFNFEQAPFNSIIQSAIFAILLTIIIFLLSYLTLIFFMSISSWKMIIQIITLAFILITLYLGLYNLLNNSTLQEMARHRFLLPVLVIVFLVFVILILKPVSIVQNLRNQSILERAAAITSLILILFFLYGHVSGLMSDGKGFARVTEIHRMLMLIWVALFAGGSILILRSKTVPAITRGINTAVAILLAMVVSQLIFLSIQNPKEPIAELPALPSSTTSSDEPDVYYIILDAYGREDLLRETINFDNTSFINELKSMGFVLPGCTQSNYHTTLLSLASTLNMNYLDKLSPDGQNFPSYYDYIPYYQQSSVMQIFEEKGYKTYTFRGQYPPLNIIDSTRFYDLFTDNSSDLPSEAQNFEYDKFTDDSGDLPIETLKFHYIFLQTTAFRVILDYLERYPRALDSLPGNLQSLIPTKDMFSGIYYQQYQQSLYHLDILNQIPEIPEKKFVYAHLYVTHEPYVFMPDGLFRWPPTEDGAAYQDQIQFMNDRLIQILQTIISKSAKPPIIVVQGDHARLWDEKRNRILNAYLLPEGGEANIYPEITPVNTFRIIFNEYFNANYDLLPDVSYYGPFQNLDMANLTLASNTCIEP